MEPKAGTIKPRSKKEIVASFKDRILGYLATGYTKEEVLEKLSASVLLTRQEQSLLIDLCIVNQEPELGLDIQEAERSRYIRGLRIVLNNALYGMKPDYKVALDCLTLLALAHGLSIDKDLEGVTSKGAPAHDRIMALCGTWAIDDQALRIVRAAFVESGAMSPREFEAGMEKVREWRRETIEAEQKARELAKESKDAQALRREGLEEKDE